MGRKGRSVNHLSLRPKSHSNDFRTAWMPPSNKSVLARPSLAIEARLSLTTRQSRDATRPDPPAGQPSHGQALATAQAGVRRVLTGTKLSGSAAEKGPLTYCASNCLRDGDTRVTLPPVRSMSALTAKSQEIFSGTHFPVAAFYGFQPPQGLPS